MNTKVSRALMFVVSTMAFLPASHSADSFSNVPSYEFREMFNSSSQAKIEDVILACNKSVVEQKLKVMKLGYTIMSETKCQAGKPVARPYAGGIPGTSGYFEETPVFGGFTFLK
jgi:hypothetical protein